MSNAILEMPGLLSDRYWMNNNNFNFDEAKYGRHALLPLSLTDVHLQYLWDRIEYIERIARGQEVILWDQGSRITANFVSRISYPDSRLLAYNYIRIDLS